MSSLPAQERLYRDAIALFVDALAEGRPATPKVTDAIAAAAELLADVGRRWCALVAAWEEQHDLLVLGVPLEYPGPSGSRSSAVSFPPLTTNAAKPPADPPRAPRDRTRRRHLPMAKTDPTRGRRQ